MIRITTSLQVLLAGIYCLIARQNEADPFWANFFYDTLYFMVVSTSIYFLLYFNAKCPVNRLYMKLILILSIVLIVFTKASQFVDDDWLRLVLTRYLGAIIVVSLVLIMDYELIFLKKIKEHEN